MPEYQYDDKQLLAYLKSLPEKRFLKEREPTIDKAELKKAGNVVQGKFLLNGQEVPGITVTEREPKFEVT